MSYFNYAYAALVGNEFDGLVVDCGPSASAVASGMFSSGCQGVVEASSLVPSTIDNGISVTGNMFILYGWLALTRTAALAVLWLRIAPWRARLSLLRSRAGGGAGEARPADVEVVARAGGAGG